MAEISARSRMRMSGMQALRIAFHCHYGRKGRNESLSCIYLTPDLPVAGNVGSCRAKKGHFYRPEKSSRCDPEQHTGGCRRGGFRSKLRALSYATDEHFSAYYGHGHYAHAYARAPVTPRRRVAVEVYGPLNDAAHGKKSEYAFLIRWRNELSW